MQEKEPLSEVQLLAGLWGNDTRTLEEIYDRFFVQVRRLVLEGGGNAEDAADVFQEGLVVLFKKKDDPDFELTAAFGTYLYGVCRYIWLRLWRKKSRSQGVTFPDSGELIDEYKVEESLVAAEKRQLFQEKMRALGDDCRRVLQLFFAGTPLREIAQEMGFTDDYIKKKNRVCKKKLTDLVRNDPRYHELKR